MKSWSCDLLRILERTIDSPAAEVLDWNCDTGKMPIYYEVLVFLQAQGDRISFQHGQ